MGNSWRDILGGMQKGKSRAIPACNDGCDEGGRGDKTAGSKVVGGLDRLQGAPMVKRRVEGAPH